MTNNYHHLSYKERVCLEDELNNNKSINQISNELNRSHSTIIREIKRNKVYSKPIIGVLIKNIKIQIMIFIVKD